MAPMPPSQEGKVPFDPNNQRQQYPAVSSPHTSPYPPQGSYPSVATQPAAVAYGYQPLAAGYNYPTQGSAAAGPTGVAAQTTVYPPQTSYAPAPYPPPATSAATASYYMDHDQQYTMNTTAAAGSAPANVPVVIGTPAFVYSQQGNEPCGCSAGWVLYGVGWIFPICWLIGAFLPCCSKNRNDRRAAIGSGIMFSLTVIAVVVSVVVPLVIMARAAESMNNTNSGWNASYGSSTIRDTNNNNFWGN